MRRNVEVFGPRDVGDAWDRYVQPARWAEWSPQIRSVDYAEPELRERTGGVVHGPLGVRVPFVILRVSPPQSWLWAVFVAGASVQLSHRVEPAATGTRATLMINGPAPMVLGYLPLARLALRRLVKK
ncbi:SRPBCC family protein [Paractinoplanes lichenicola]|uniref:SRPBCC family protein n=1 Tax=Paractinoplanes lichenicola TaxID=2802976 RepID=A0ABS1VPM3_9ACTN|nr:SRPBCC family protein [Actinoplanes lichenicola]MBL7255702.1 SRPBCC family protein [Actinoplanes lichenicola]